jgi:hypothetical protein
VEDEELADPTEEQRITALAESIDKALLPGNGRTNRCDTVAELQDRLTADGVVYNVDDVPAALAHLEANDRLKYGPRPQPTKFDRHPERPFVRQVPRWWD